MGSRGPGRADQEKGTPTIIFWASLINRELAPALILSTETLYDCKTTESSPVWGSGF